MNWIDFLKFFENISLEASGNDFNLTTNVNKKKLKFQISNHKSKIPAADVTNKRQRLHWGDAE